MEAVNSDADFLRRHAAQIASRFHHEHGPLLPFPPHRFRRAPQFSAIPVYLPRSRCVALDWAAPMAHPDLDRLLNSALSFAQQMLGKRGAFFPFGCSMNARGEVSMDATYTGQEQPPSQEVIDSLTESYTQRAGTGELRAAAICADVRVVPPGVTDKSDAISVALEHRSAEAVTVFLPYRKGWFGRVRYGTLFASARDAQFFRHRDPV